MKTIFLNNKDEKKHIEKKIFKTFPKILQLQQHWLLGRLSRGLKCFFSFLLNAHVQLRHEGLDHRSHSSFIPKHVSHVFHPKLLICMDLEQFEAWNALKISWNVKGSRQSVSKNKRVKSSYWEHSHTMTLPPPNSSSSWTLFSMLSHLGTICSEECSKNPLTY